MQAEELLTREQRESFEESGFLRIPSALAPEAVTALRDICLRRRDRERTAVKEPVGGDDWRDQFHLPTHELQAACDTARWEAFNVVASDPGFMNLIDQPSVLRAAVDLLSENIFLMSSRAMIRDRVPMSMEEFTRFPLDWHRDLGTSAVEMAQPIPGSRSRQLSG